VPRFADAVIDPDVHAVVRSAARIRPSASRAAMRARAVERALHVGPRALDRSEQFALLWDAVALGQLRSAALAEPVHASWYATPAARGRATIHRFGTQDRGRTRSFATRARQPR
jgi:membrane glycosyltransferase